LGRFFLTSEFGVTPELGIVESVVETFRRQEFMMRAAFDHLATSKFDL
jgi:hypothetical protein